MTEHSLPLFPLHTVLFPGGLLRLRIFEPRYLDMVSACLCGDTPFGVCLIRNGSEVGRAAETHEIGTLARIVDWHARADGTLGLAARGGQRFRLRASTVQSDQLRRAEVELLPQDAAMPLPERYQALGEALRRVLPDLGEQFAAPGECYRDASWVGYRLAELLPIPLLQKQRLLQLDGALDRLERLSGLFPGAFMRSTPH